MIDHNFVMNLPAALFATPMLHLDTAVTKNCIHAYQDDLQFFNEHPHRRLTLRPAQEEEFTATMTIEDFMQMPQLQTLVVKLSQGVHLCLLVHLGRKLTQHVQYETDADVEHALLKMQHHRGGYADDEFVSFLHMADKNQKIINNALQAGPNAKEN